MRKCRRCSVLKVGAMTIVIRVLQITIVVALTVLGDFILDSLIGALVMGSVGLYIAYIVPEMVEE